MMERFLKLIYVLALVAIGVSFPIYLLSHINFEDVVSTEYRARCLANNEYVVMQGSPVGDAWKIDEIMLRPSLFNPDTGDQTKATINFYCKYYNQIQPHIQAYNLAKDRSQEVEANKKFFEFESSVGQVSSYPSLYKLEVASETVVYYKIYSPVIEGALIATFYFLILQFLRISLLYVMYGKIIWHPFGKIPRKS